MNDSFFSNQIIDIDTDVYLSERYDLPKNTMFIHMLKTTPSLDTLDCLNKIILNTNRKNIRFFLLRYVSIKEIKELKKIISEILIIKNKPKEINNILLDSRLFSNGKNGYIFYTNEDSQNCLDNRLLASAMNLI